LTIKRAYVLMLVAASMLWVLIGPASMTVAAAGPDSGTRGSTATAPAFDDHDGDPRHGCHHGGRGEASTAVCCGNSHPDSGSDDGTKPRPAPTPKAIEPTVRPHAATVTSPKTQTAPPATPPPTTTPAGSPPGDGPPVIAPPALTIPALNDLPTGTHSGPGTTYAIALAAVLVAATIAIATLIRIRRSD
jgi:hypothetical protein